MSCRTRVIEHSYVGSRGQPKRRYRHSWTLKLPKPSAIMIHYKSIELNHELTQLFMCTECAWSVRDTRPIWQLRTINKWLVSHKRSGQNVWYYYDWICGRQCDNIRRKVPGIRKFWQANCLLCTIHRRLPTSRALIYHYQFNFTVTHTKQSRL